MKSYVQVLGAGTLDGGGPAILIFFDDERYLINCGEGLQRFCGEHRIKLGKLSHIFLTGLSWDCVGGIPGLISTVADAGSNDRLQIVGPKNTEHFVAAMRPFLHRANFSVAIDELGQDRPTYSDSKLKIRVIELRDKGDHTSDTLPESKRRRSDSLGVENLTVTASPTTPNHFILKMFKDPSKYGTPVSEDVLSSRSHYLKEEGDRMTHSTQLPHTKPTGSALIYIIEGPEIPGKFLSEKAKALGIPHGPLNGKLQKGESVILNDGSVVTPEMCIGPATPGPLMVYLSVPTIDHVADLMGKLDQLPFDSDRLKLVIHYAPKKVYHSDIYRNGQFVNWNTEVKHIHIDESFQHCLESPLFFMRTLRTDSPKPAIYPMPFGERRPEEVLPLMKYNWINTTKKARFEDDEDALQFTKRLEVYEQVVDEPYPIEHRLTILGTGAALPGKYRNVSSTLFTFEGTFAEDYGGENGTDSILFDCGEGTLGQLLRCFGSRFEAIFKTISLVFISHLHTDHHAGLMNILRKRQELGIEKPLWIIGPKRFLLWLQECSECHPIRNFVFKECEEVGHQFENWCIWTVPVEHCPRSYAAVAVINDTFRVVYSGDTRPCDLRGEGAQLLIHEATMGDDLQEEAICKRHSTITEAIDVGKRMRVKHTVLTHFSQRYAKTAPPLPQGSDKVSVAFDLMTVNLADLHLIEGNAYNERLRKLLPEEADHVES